MEYGKNIEFNRHLCTMFHGPALWPVNVNAQLALALADDKMADTLTRCAQKYL